MNKYDFYIEGDKLINQAFEFLKVAVYRDPVDGVDYFYFHADVFSIEKEDVKLNQMIINVLLHYDLITDFGLAQFIIEGDFRSLFVLTKIGERFKNNELKFKKWIVHAEKKRREDAERERDEKFEPIEMAVKGAVRAAIIGAILASIFTFIFGLLTALIIDDMIRDSSPQNATEPTISEESNDYICPIIGKGEY